MKIEKISSKNCQQAKRHVRKSTQSAQKKKKKKRVKGVKNARFSRKKAHFFRSKKRILIVFIVFT
jgi:hypothetical protein